MSHDVATIYMQLFVTQHVSMGYVLHLIHAHVIMDGKETYVKDVMPIGYAYQQSKSLSFTFSNL